MSHSIHFYDSASPENIPSGVYAAAYVNGFAWSLEEIDRMRAIIRISVLPEPEWANLARVIDVENGAAQPNDVPAFIRQRRSHGYRDATAYVNRSNWRTVYDIVREEGLSCLYWVSTLDGNQDPEGPCEPWAVQYYGGVHTAYDLSVLKGQDTFHRP